MDVIDLNCDMGESFGAWTMGSDAEMLKIVSSANVACGFHGGDPLVMFETVSHAKENEVGIGAHPSFSMSGALAGARSRARSPTTS